MNTPLPPQTPTNRNPAKPAPLYAAHKKVYPKSITGTFQRIKRLMLIISLAIYYIAPWIRWNRGPSLPNQAVLADIASGKIYFFNLEIWPQEIYYLTGLLVLGAVGLFLATAIAGRVWCGFACPQTLWTDLFLRAERYFEGDRNKRIRLDGGPFTLDKVKRKIAKHFVWIAISLATGGAWIFYFTDAPTALLDMLTGRASYTVYGFTALFTGTTYLLAGWAREQVCTYMCPWPRFQSAMFDENSLIITYETWRGEPRSKFTDATDTGDCVECNMCVNVCPTGIDIRDGLQLECIGCALCVDACNEVMEKLGRPGNLIAYDSISNQFAREHNQPTKTALIRPRTVIYAIILVLVFSIMAYGLMTRSDLGITVQRNRSPLFVTLSDGAIQNGYTFNVQNMTNTPRTFIISTTALPNARLHIIGITTKPTDSATLKVGADSVGSFRVYVRAPHKNLKKRFNDLNFILKDVKTGKTFVFASKFSGPTK